ncbi:MAG: O-antigen flippase [uncultured Sulfurovum sp.]|uniref:O-antigen flippase n=1 Tax=uncultured Sulfurovum sp. TaxID=269237 RepID=A0A6S6TZ65_9BACT|nr:MAG: O-antigen flippase [uncultured Sulfurovum sp.]
MTLIKTSILTAIATIIRVITSFIINKLISIYIGPSGLALIGQLQNFITITTTFSKGAISQGVIKYTAEYFDDNHKKNKIFSTAVIITLCSSIIVGIFLNFFSNYFSEVILKSNEYNHLFLSFSFLIILFAFNTLILSILNGQKEIKKYVLINIVSSVFSLVFTSFLIIKFGLLGALYALILNQSIIFFITLLFMINSAWFSVKDFMGGWDKSSGIKLGKFALMAVVTALTIPVSHLIVREYIGTNLSWDAAGYWQSIWYISTMYLMVVTTSLGIYYLPKLSEIKDNKLLKIEIFNGYKIIMPIVSALALSIYIFREDIIYIAFTDKFLPMLELFKWQLIGDIIKIASWLLSTLMLAKAMTKIFVITEILFSISFTVLSIIFINYFGLIGITYAYSLNYLLYLILMIVIFRRRFI